MTSIKVKSNYDEELVTAQVRDEFGDLVKCNHYGAEEEELEFTTTSWWEDAHVAVSDDSVMRSALVCDKCDAWQDLDGCWRND